MYQDSADSESNNPPDSGSPPSRTRVPTAIEIGWAAGFADGESCIHIAKQRYLTRRRPTYRLGFHLTQNDLEVLEHFRDVVGVVSRITEVRLTPQHKRQCYTLNLTGKKAVSVITLLAPHLVRKRPEADAAQAFWADRAGVRDDGAPGTVAEVDATREHYFQLLKKLK